MMPCNVVNFLMCSNEHQKIKVEFMQEIHNNNHHDYTFAENLTGLPCNAYWIL